MKSPLGDRQVAHRLMFGITVMAAALVVIGAGAPHPTTQRPRRTSART